MLSPFAQSFSPPRFDETYSAKNWLCFGLLLTLIGFVIGLALEQIVRLARS